MKRRTIQVDDKCNDLYRPLCKRYRLKPGQHVCVKFTSGRVIDCVALKKVWSCRDPEAPEYGCVFKDPSTPDCVLSRLMCYATKPAVWLCPVSSILEEL